MAQDNSSNFTYDGTVYPDEFTATALNHPDIPDTLKTEFKTALGSTEKPAGEFKSSQGTQVAPTYDTPLDPSQEAVYSTRFGPDASRDYDMRGWFLQNPTQLPNAEGVHYPDTFKKPNHITFSDQSKYSTGDTKGGQWAENEDGTYTFTPSSFNLDQHSPSELKDYFAQYEKGNTLNLDTAQGIAAQASEKAADALKRAQNTTPTLDSDTGIRGTPIAQTPDYLRKLGIDTTITDQDIDEAQNIALSFSGGGLSTKFMSDAEILKSAADFGKKAAQETPYNPVLAKQLHLDYLTNQTPENYNAFIKEQSKAPPQWDYEQMGNGKFEVFNATTGITHHVVDSKQQAEQFVSDLKVADQTTKALEQIKADLDKGMTNPLYEQKPLVYNEKTAQWEDAPVKNPVQAWEDYVDKYVSEKKLSPKEAFIEGANKAAFQLQKSLQAIQRKFLDTIREPALEGPNVRGTYPYTEPSYKGMAIEPGTEVNPVFNFNKAYSEMYSSASPRLAEMYARMEKGTPPGYTVKEGHFGEGSTVAPLLIDTRDYLTYDAKGKSYIDVNHLAINQAKKEGKLGIKVLNVHDEPVNTSHLPPQTVYITLPEGAHTVKSRFAREFNPNSKNMLHSIAAIGATGTLGTVAYDLDNQQP